MNKRFPSTESNRVLSPNLTGGELLYGLHLRVGCLVSVITYTYRLGYR